MSLPIVATKVITMDYRLSHTTTITTLASMKPDTRATTTTPGNTTMTPLTMAVATTIDCHLSTYHAHVSVHEVGQEVYYGSSWKYHHDSGDDDRGTTMDYTLTPHKLP
jgi:hypothetical protein